MATATTTARAQMGHPLGRPPVHISGRILVLKGRYDFDSNTSVGGRSGNYTAVLPFEYCTNVRVTCEFDEDYTDEYYANTAWYILGHYVKADGTHSDFSLIDHALWNDNASRLSRGYEVDPFTGNLSPAGDNIDAISFKIVWAGSTPIVRVRYLLRVWVNAQYWSDGMNTLYGNRGRYDYRWDQLDIMTPFSTTEVT